MSDGFTHDEVPKPESTVILPEELPEIKKDELRAKLKTVFGLIQNRQPDWYREFQKIYLNIYDVERAFESATDDWVQTLVSKGIQADSTQIKSNMDLVLTRLNKIAIVKHLCTILGLHDEYDRIIEKELDLIYLRITPGFPKPPAPHAQSNVVVGAKNVE